jgi:Trm5-related predicted tRNA methylase
MMTFSTPEELEERILRACTDPEWRDRLSTETRQRVIDHMSMGQFAEKLMRFLCTELGCPAPAEQGVLS